MFLIEFAEKIVFSVYVNPVSSLGQISYSDPIQERRFVSKTHLKIKGAGNYYFKTIGYCSRTKVKSPLILRRFSATWPWPPTLNVHFSLLEQSSKYYNIP